MALVDVGIKLYGGVSGSCDAAVEAFLAYNLGYSRRESNAYALRRAIFASFAKSRLARSASCFNSL